MKSFTQVAIAIAALALATPALAQEKVWHHGLSLMGELKYPEGFKQFDFVNPDAPKGGTVRLSELGTFDSFNPIATKGVAATGIGLVYETLMTPSMDESSTEYAGIAEAVSFPDDFSSVTFRLDPDAKWHDGQPITPEDVVWTFEKCVEVNISLKNYYANVTGAEKTGDHEVTFTFNEKNNRELPQIIGQLPVLPKHWWEGTGADGKPRDIAESTLEPMLGSGPYMIDKFTAGVSVSYKRVPDYWGAGKPVNIGQNNFDEIRYEYFRDTDVEFEAFKGDQFDWWDENRAKRWATAYEIPAVTEGRIIKELFPQTYRPVGVMVGFIFNTRLPKFQDERVRRAINYAFDFEELSRTLFYGQYARISSYFFGTELASSGLPEGEELEILKSLGDKVPASVFTETYTNPISGDAAKLRENLRTALGLLTEAGYKLDGNSLVGPDGQPLTIEIMLSGPTIEPVAANLQTNLRKIGIVANIVSADDAQFTDRVRKRDFEMFYGSWTQSLSPGNEQRDFWGSAAADQENSRNYPGIKDPAVDALIDKIIFADDRETIIAATRALDRVLLAHNYVLPSYSLRNSRIARWDRFSHADKLPEFSIGFPTIWWWDEAKAAKTGGAN
jgi:microcin C transport system substrate-binding protein